MEIPESPLRQSDRNNGRRQEKIAIALEFLRDKNGEECCLEEVLARVRKIIDVKYSLESKPRRQTITMADVDGKLSQE